MVILAIILLTIFVISYFISSIKYGTIFKGIDRKEHKLYFLYPISYMFIQIFKLDHYLNKNSKIRISLQSIYLTSRPEGIQRLYWCKKVAMVLFILISFQFLILMLGLNSMGEELIKEGNYIERPEPGEGRARVDLRVKLNPMDQEGDGGAQDKPLIKDLTVEIEEEAYTYEEMMQAFQEAILFLSRDVLGKNESPEHIIQNLNFIASIPGSSISVSWIPENTNLIRSDGTVMNEDIEEGGIETRVTAVLTYGEEAINYEIPLTVFPKVYTEEEILSRKLEEELEKYSEMSRWEDKLYLPSELENYNIEWKTNGGKTEGTLMTMGIVTAILVWFYSDKELDKQMNERKKQMLLDYPEIINKFTLLVNAGMTIRQAWYKISEDYKRKTLHNSLPKRYAYEEMLITQKELMLGIAEYDAYEQFGRRAGLQPYMKFASLLTQSLKKGNRGLSEILRYEAKEAFENRKEAVKRLGEEAGTKLLGPMMILLIIVFIIVTVPAILSFNI